MAFKLKLGMADQPGLGVDNGCDQTTNNENKIASYGEAWREMGGDSAG
jgi:hypothetical protein